MESQDNNFEETQIQQSEKEKRSAETVFGRLSMRTLIGIVILTVFLSSLFGAFFGLVSAGAVSIFSPKINQKIQKYFPDKEFLKTDRQDIVQEIIVEDSAIIDTVGKVSPSVVSIVISKEVSNNLNGFNFPEGFFNPFGLESPGLDGNQQNGTESQRQTIGGGSGFFITTDGYILTNRHVVEDQQATYAVMTSDGKEYEAKILARDPIRDVAVMKIEGSNFPVVTLGDSDSLKIGQTAIAIGNSLGEFSNSVSRGIISGLKRNLNAGSIFGGSERLTDIIQTDAAINPGNSGGPLLDIEGRVIGINVAVAQGAQNVGFALPINQATRIIEQVKTGTRISVPYLGVRYIVIDSTVKKDASLPFDYGVLVLRGDKMTDLAVIPGSPADLAGIMENDIVLEINGQKINTENQLGDLIVKYDVGDEITLKVWHRGETRDVKVKLQERKN